VFRLNFREDRDVSGKSGHLFRDLTVAVPDRHARQVRLQQAVGWLVDTTTRRVAGFAAELNAVRHGACKAARSAEKAINDATTVGSSQQWRSRRAR
jgi:hypothetical protein